MRYLTGATAVAVLGTALLLLPGSAGAQEGEWRQWGGPHGDFYAESAGLAEQWPATGPAELWSRQLGAGHSSILAAGGRLFTMYRESHGDGGSSPWTPSESVIAMDAGSGATLWEYTYASKNQDFGQGAGPHATPLLIGGRLFTMGSNKELHVFDPQTGDLLWSKNLITDFGAPPLLIRSMVKPGSGMSPIPYKDTILLQVGGPGQAVMALRQSDGEVVWKSGSFLVSHAPVGFISVAGRQHAVVFAGQGVFGLDPDTGQVLWGIPTTPATTSTSRFRSTTKIRACCSSRPATSAAARRSDWCQTVTSSTPSRCGPTPCCGSPSSTRCRSATSSTAPGGQGATAVLTATHMESGETAWRERGFSRASMVYGDGKAILMEEDGDLSLVRLSPNGLETLATTPLFDTRSWTVPTLVGTTLYARDRERIVALDLGTR